jgi:hypothetical protein
MSAVQEIAPLANSEPERDWRDRDIERYQQLGFGIHTIVPALKPKRVPVSYEFGVEDYKPVQLTAEDIEYEEEYWKHIKRLKDRYGDDNIAVVLASEALTQKHELEGRYFVVMVRTREYQDEAFDKMQAQWRAPLTFDEARLSKDALKRAGKMLRQSLQ